MIEDKKDFQIVELSASGLNQTQIAKIVGIDRSRVCRRMQKGDVREYLEKLQMELVTECLETAKNNITSLISGYKTAPEKTMEKEHGYRASIKVMEAAGLFPSNNTSVYIQNIYNDKTDVPPEVKRLLDEIVSRDLNQKNLLEE